MNDEFNETFGEEAEKVAKMAAQLELLLAKHRSGQERSPESMRELARGVGSDLLAIASKPTKIVRQTLSAIESGVGAVASFLSGTSALPSAIADRIRGNRAVADAREDQKQAAIEDSTTAAVAPAGASSVSGVHVIPPRAAAREALRQWMERIRAKGHCAEAFEISGLGFLLIFGPQEAVPQLLESGIRALQSVKSLPAPRILPALPMPEDNEDEHEFLGLDKKCTALLKAANVTRADVLQMSEEELLEIDGIGKKRAGVIQSWVRSA